MAATLELTHPLPKYGAADVLRQQIVSQLLTARPSTGTKLFTDEELAAQAGVSHSTARRVLRELSREGWLVRRSGYGSFVGPRVALASADAGMNHSKERRGLIRMLVLTGQLGDPRSVDARRVLEGIDSVALEHGVATEILGAHTDQELGAISQRFMQNRPDVVVCLVAPGPLHAFIVGEAKRQGIPCIGSGARALALGLPGVCGDGVQGGRLAAHHLLEHGHRRIGLLMGEEAAPWVFQRRRGYRQALIDAGVHPDENLVLWLDDEQQGPTRQEQVRWFLDEQQPTAVISAHRYAEQPLLSIVRESPWRCPEALSVITFGHYRDQEHWESVGSPTHISPPTEEMGRWLTDLARRITRGEPADEQVALPYQLVQGHSVAPL